MLTSTLDCLRLVLKTTRFNDSESTLSCETIILYTVHFQISNLAGCFHSLKVRSHQMRMKRYARMIYMLSQCKDAIDNPVALFAGMRRRELCGANLAFGAFDACYSRELKNLKFGGYSRRVNQSGACSSSEVITSGGRKSEKTMEDKLIVVVCGYPELYDTTSYFYKNRNKLCSETGAAWQKPLPWSEFASVV